MKFPYGVSDFRQVIGEGYYFVDRSDPAGLRAAGEGGGIEQSVGPGRPGGRLGLAMCFTGARYFRH